MLQKNHDFDLTIDALGADAEGVGRIDGIAVFVPGALPGERVRARIIKTEKRYAVGKLLSVCTPSPERATPPCPVYARCGGCAMQHMTYAATLRAKKARLTDALQRIGHLENVPVDDVVGMTDPFRYRNKGACPVGGTANAPKLGFYAPRSHDIIDAPTGCLLQKPESDALVAALRAWITRTGVLPYDETAHAGCIRHLVTRIARDGRAYATLVVREVDTLAPHMPALIDAFRQAVPALEGVALSVSPDRTNVIFGADCTTVWGAPTLRDTLCSLTFSLAPRAFFQVNALQTEALYQRALDDAALTPNDTVLDLYCGAGTITLLLAQHAKQAVGIEIVPDAIENARQNAARNGVPNARFLAGDAETVLPRLLAEGLHPDVVVMDPPRKGCAPSVLDAVAKVAPRRVIYVSCDPATLARDAALLTEKGYRLTRAQPVDMFCWSAGVETVATFVRSASTICG